MVRIKEFVHKKSLIIAILGIMLLAIGVNLVELLCSAGLPMIYGEVLAINKITGPKALVYDLIYILFFMLDDFIVFFVAIKTMNLASISNKFSKYSHLIAGIIMLIIGILLIIKPSWLMFNF
jgi:cadmium resistance protein CadD (predicted permease)